MPIETSVEAKDDVDVVAKLKAFAAFLSYFKMECGTEARHVQQNLKTIIKESPLDGCSNDIFIDSDDLSDLRNLLDHVREWRVDAALGVDGTTYCAHKRCANRYVMYSACGTPHSIRRT